MDLLTYIRNLFSDLRDPITKRNDFGEPIRKRKLISESTFGFPKYRRVSGTFPQMDDVILSSKISKRPSLSTLHKFPSDVVVLDDEEDLREKKSKYTSTPTNKYQKENSISDDDIAFVKEIKSSNNQRTFKFDISKPFSLFRTLEAAADRNKRSSTRTDKILQNCNTKKKSWFNFPNYTTRLDDKKEFQNLLESHISDSSNNTSSRYHTPCSSRLSRYDSIGLRGKNNMGSFFSKSNNSSTTFVDLTNGNENSKLNASNKHQHSRNSNQIENVAVISDSDSEVELVRPPTPEPDFKVKPINSLKVEFKDQYSKDNIWLDNMMKEHNEKIKSREGELKKLAENNRQLNEINREMRLGVLNRRIDKCLKIKDIVLPIEILDDEEELPELTDEQLMQIQHAFKGGPQHEVLVKKYGLNITRKDICTLYGLNWLNDEVINFYMNMIMDRGNGEKYPKAHCFNTFFYPKILKDGPESVRRWTRRSNTDIFEKDLIIVPIHLGVHWCMAIIDMRDRSIRYYDSMGNSNERCLQALRNYLEAEHLDKKKSKFDTSDFILECPKDIPQQMNGSDCGMFSCMTAEFYSRDVKLNYSQEQMPYFRKKMVYEILQGELMIK